MGYSLQLAAVYAHTAYASAIRVLETAARTAVLTSGLQTPQALLPPSNLEEITWQLGSAPSNGYEGNYSPVSMNVPFHRGMKREVRKPAGAPQQMPARQPRNTQPHGHGSYRWKNLLAPERRNSRR